MKLITILLFTGLALNIFPAIAQEKGTTLENQFVDLIEKSNRYQDYKVVKIYKLNSLKKNVTDSIAVIEKKLETAKGTITEQKNEIGTLSQNLTSLQTQLTTSKGKEDGIELFGILFKKSTYKTAMWVIIGLLGLIVLFLSFKFKSSNSITKEANLKLVETEEEFESHRQVSLEREQQLRRKLQDEINKNSKN